jgi:hypothetical protein
MIKRRLTIFLGGALGVVGLFVAVVQPSGATSMDGSTSSSSTSSSSTSTSSTSSSTTTSSTTTTTTPPGEEGCTPGFWKNHPEAWVGFMPGQTLGSVFDPVLLGDLAGVTLLEALSFEGGPTLTDAQEILLRQAVAALLNAAHPDVDFSLSEEEVIEDVEAALATGDRETILALAEELAAANEAGCPL